MYAVTKVSSVLKKVMIIGEEINKEESDLISDIPAGIRSQGTRHKVFYQMIRKGTSYTKSCRICHPARMAKSQGRGPVYRLSSKNGSYGSLPESEDIARILFPLTSRLTQNRRKK